MNALKGRWFVAAAALTASACQSKPKLASESTKSGPTASSAAVAFSACPAPKGKSLPVPFDSAGMEPLCGEQIYVERSVTAGERTTIKQYTQRAVAAVAKTFGTSRSSGPLTAYCATDECGRYFAGPSLRAKTLAPGVTAVGGGFSDPNRTTVVIPRLGERTYGTLLHELTHVEVNARLGGAFAPAWFHEGLATRVSGAPNCKGVPRGGITDMRFLEGHRAWNEFTNRPGALAATYCQARREIDTWADKRGTGALVQLISKVGSGTAFYEAYGPTVTRCEGGCVDW